MWGPSFTTSDLEVRSAAIDKLSPISRWRSPSAQSSSIGANIRACGERIFQFHVADSNRWYPGAGHLDFDSILAALFSTDYQGWVSGEFLPKPDVIVAAEKGLFYLRK